MSIPELIRSLSSPLEPVPAGVDPVLPRLPGIRCVAFDIYGTLVISGSGDIGIATATGREEVMRSLLAGAGLADPPDDLVGRFLELIRADHERARATGTPHPEVEIREVWRDFLGSLGLAPDPPAVERLAVRYECAVNPVWPMPGLGAMLAALRSRDLPLAIVSNAQFFTPLLFEAFLGDPPGRIGFDDDLAVYSFAHRHAKPGKRLYQLLAGRLAGRGIGAAETLYVGNDMRNDIAPAAGLGFRTALFAGDRRSLRLREEDRLGVEPDAIVTALDQLPGMLG
jgi:putative hydrolase of the HAD superfamily